MKSIILFFLFLTTSNSYAQYQQCWTGADGMQYCNNNQLGDPYQNGQGAAYNPLQGVDDATNFNAQPSQNLNANQNCVEDFETGEVICDRQQGNLREVRRPSSNTPPPPSRCESTHTITKSKCNSIQFLQNPQNMALVNSIQANRNAGNIRQACEAAKQINQASWGLNAAYAVQCDNAINKCLSDCTLNSTEYAACEKMQTTVRLAKNQSVENAKAYAASQECVTAAASCGSGSYDNPNCPQYCQRPGRQNDSLCKNTSLAQESQYQVTLATTASNTPKPTGGVDLNSGSGYRGYIGLKKNPFSDSETSGSGSGAKAKTNTTGKQAAIAGPTTTQKTQNEISNNNKPKPTSPTARAQAGSIAGTDSMYNNPSSGRGYVDAPTEVESDSWFDFKRFLPGSEEEKINKNMTQYHRKLLAESQRRANAAKRTNSNIVPSAITAEHARNITSVESKNTFTYKSLVILSLSILLLGAIYFFLKKTPEN